LSRPRSYPAVRQEIAAQLDCAAAAAVLERIADVVGQHFLHPGRYPHGAGQACADIWPWYSWDQRIQALEDFPHERSHVRSVMGDVVHLAPPCQEQQRSLCFHFMGAAHDSRTLRWRISAA
jgi:hypothetical protein